MVCPAALHKNCLSILRSSTAALPNGTYTIYPFGDPISVWCDMTTDDGGWTLVARLPATESNAFLWNHTDHDLASLALGPGSPGPAIFATQHVNTLAMGTTYRALSDGGQRLYWRGAPLILADVYFVPTSELFPLVKSNWSSSWLNGHSTWPGSSHGRDIKTQQAYLVGTYFNPRRGGMAGQFGGYWGAGGIEACCLL